MKRQMLMVLTSLLAFCIVFTGCQTVPENPIVSNTLGTTSPASDTSQPATPESSMQSNTQAPTDVPTKTPPEESMQHTHVWNDWTTVQEATCVYKGQKERICGCGVKETKEISKTRHTGDKWIIDKEATLKEVGKKHQLCSVCGTVFNEKTIPTLTVNVLPGTTDTYQDPLRPNYALANCRRLEGNPVVVLIFIDDNESCWTEAEVVAFTQEHILVGLNYLESNAQKWGVDLDFVVESYSTPLSGYEIKYEGTVNPDLHNGGSTKDVLDKAAADIGCDSNWELYSYYKAKYPKDDIVFLNFLNKSGKSYARNAISTGYMEYSEHCVIFADYLGESSALRKDGSRAATVAHEILHLFGAEDFYTSYTRESLANKKYPNDIMLWQYDNIQDNKIGDCTAFSVGWTDVVPEVCYDDYWWK